MNKKHLKETFKTYQLNRSEYNNREENDRLNILSDKIYQDSSHKFKQTWKENYLRFIANGNG